jgi:1-Cys peroxiredoxin 6
MMVGVTSDDGGLDFHFNPVVLTESREVSVKYGMLDPNNKDGDDLPLTIRAVFIIGPDLKLKLSLNYPASVGRNMEEIVRCVKALKLSADNSIATPANWPNNHAELNMDGTEMKGSVFLLPTVSNEDAAKHFPGHKICDVPSGKEYLRLVHLE